MHYVEFTHRCKAFESLPLQVFTIHVRADGVVMAVYPTHGTAVHEHKIGPVLLSKLRGMAADSVTDDQIRALENRALETGDDVLLGRCIGALGGNRRARIAVAAIVDHEKREAKSDFQALLVGRDVASLASGFAQAAFPTVPCVSVEVTSG